MYLPYGQTPRRPLSTAPGGLGPCPVRVRLMRYEMAPPDPLHLGVIVARRRERELQVAERGLVAQPDPDQARQLVDLLPLLDVDAALLAERSFRELLAAL